MRVRIDLPDQGKPIDIVLLDGCTRIEQGSVSIFVPYYCIRLLAEKLMDIVKLKSHCAGPGIVLAGTKPTDYTCRQQAINQVAGSNGMLPGIVMQTGAASLAIGVNDLVYKQVVSNINGQQIGIGILGTVIFTQ